MQKDDVRPGRDCTFNLHCHLVFLTKYRRKVFTAPTLKTIETLFIKVCGDFDAEIMEFNGAGDHIHILINYPPKVAISKLVNSLKGVSSRRLKILHPEITCHYWQAKLWSPSYFAGSVGGPPLDLVKQYIEQQAITE